MKLRFNKLTTTHKLTGIHNSCIVFILFLYSPYAFSVCHSLSLSPPCILTGPPSAQPLTVSHLVTPMARIWGNWLQPTTCGLVWVVPGVLGHAECQVALSNSLTFSSLGLSPMSSPVAQSPSRTAALPWTSPFWTGLGVPVCLLPVGSFSTIYCCVISFLKMQWFQTARVSSWCGASVLLGPPLFPSPPTPVQGLAGAGWLGLRMHKAFRVGGSPTWHLASSGRVFQETGFTSC